MLRYNQYIEKIILNNEDVAMTMEQIGEIKRRSKYLIIQVPFIELEYTCSDLLEKFGHDLFFENIKDYWNVKIELASHHIIGWKNDYGACQLNMKVADRGTYVLLDENSIAIFISSGYVINSFLPPRNGYGDYLELSISEEGVITNWYETPDFSDFCKNGTSVDPDEQKFIERQLNHCSPLKVIFLLENSYADWQIGNLPVTIKAKNRYESFFVSSSPTFPDVTSLCRLESNTYHTIGSINDFEAIILVGSKDWYIQSNRKEVQRLLQIAVMKDKYIAAIGDGVKVLATLGLLEGCLHTADSLEDMTGRYTLCKSYNANNYYRDVPCVCDGKIITAKGNAIWGFCRMVMTVLKADTKENIENNYKYFTQYTSG